MKYSGLIKHLPANSIDAGLSPQRFKLDLNALTSNNLSLDSSIIEGLVRYLQGVYDFSEATNQQREIAGSPKIDLITKNIRISEKGNPIYEYTVSIEVNSSATFDGVIDPATEV